MTVESMVSVLLLPGLVSVFLVGPVVGAVAVRVRRERRAAQVRRSQREVARAVSEIGTRAQAALLAEVARCWRQGR